MECFAAITAGLNVSDLTGAVAWLARGERYHKRVNAAPANFTTRLGVLIDQAVTEGPQNVRVNARAILAMRDGFRRVSINISDLLNSEMDALSAQLNKGVVHRPMVVRAEQQNAPENVSDELFVTVKVIQRAWQGKRDELDATMRQLLSLLGLDRA